MCSSLLPSTGGSTVLQNSGPLSPPAILRPSFSPEPICSGYGSGRLKVGIIQAVRKVRSRFSFAPLLNLTQLRSVSRLFISRACGFTVPETIAFSSVVTNPALPPRKTARLPPRLQPISKSVTSTNGVGPRRVYLDIQSPESGESHPPRPVTGSIADLDIVMKHCDFSTNQVMLVSPPSRHKRLVHGLPKRGSFPCSVFLVN